MHAIDMICTCLSLSLNLNSTVILNMIQHDLHPAISKNCMKKYARTLIEEGQEGDPNLFGLREFPGAGLIGLHSQGNFLVALVDSSQLHVDLGTKVMLRVGPLDMT